ncbi:MAG: nitroreductase family deazaflavin-dependent oxidoreductase [Mycobacterium sp.]|nr:nitroreductase family deazaflavin-dependent oxidoreductase [Mycobacterium sp.]
MSFTTSNGSRGARQPQGRLLRMMNGVISRRIRKGGKLMGGTEGLVLTTIGRKSGERRSTPLVWFPGANGSWLIVASAAGAPRNPAWYYNIAAHPDRVEIEIGGRKIPVTAVQLHGAEREDAWRAITSAAERFTKYQEQTDRELPIIRLTAR